MTKKIMPINHFPYLHVIRLAYLVFANKLRILFDQRRRQVNLD